MTFRDLVDLSVANLWRIKLRATLTIAGVVIAIATLVALLSFAAGNQRYVNEGYQELGLLTRMNVFPRRSNAEDDTVKAAVLDREAMEKLAEIPGVKLVYPYVTFDVSAAVADTLVTTSARSLPTAAVESQLFTTVLGGATFTSSDAREAIVTRDFLDLVGVEHPDSLVGRQLVISMKVASVDSALAQSIGTPRQAMRDIMGTVRMDSLRHPDYQRRLFETELSARASRFLDGLMNHQVTIADTVVVKAVASDSEKYQLRVAPIVITENTARRLSSAGLGVGSDPAALFAAMQSGELFRPAGAADKQSFPRVTLDMKPQASATAVKDSVEALGFRAVSFAEQFEEIQRFFIYYYLGLGVLGLIALATASLGIVNTMVMSITERRREIGILKSLGADERTIRFAFLVESAAIGVIGSAIGILFGWLGTRVASFIGKIVMERIEMPIFEPFALPMWLIFLALGFGVVVSLLAGSYPARRASRVDPVEALRSE